MGSLRTLTILLALGAWGAATEGASPDDVTSPASGTTRPPLAAPVVEYLKGGISLYNTGDQAKAALYLKVANDYRDQLQPSDAAKLDTYLAKMNPALVDSAVKPASTDAATSGAPAPIDASAAGIGAPRGSGDPKSEARWKLQAARDQMRQGNYDEASRIVVEVQKMNIRWGLFDETPTKLADAIAKARPKATASASPAAVAHDKKAAVAKLKEAHDLLANNQYDQAELIAMEVKTWGLPWSMFEEKPEKIAAQARALRKRDQQRTTPAKMQQSPEQYDVLVSEARHYVATGQYDLAEAKATQAMKMNVYPNGTADRAESVLNAISEAKNKSASNAVASAAASNMNPNAALAATETASLAAEREANGLLAAGKTKEAAAKFTEAEILRNRENSGMPAIASAVPPVDRAVRQVATPAEAMPAAEVAVQAPLQVPADPTVPPALGNLPPVADSAPQPIADPAMPAVAMPAPEAAPLASAPPSLSSDVAPAGNKGEELLSQARALFSGGNYAAAREKATEAKMGGFGVDAQAEEMLSQIGLSEQGGALAVYEAALDAMRKNDPDRARALLNEVAALGSTLDPGMLDKVQNLLMKLPKEGAKGTATASDVPVNDAETLMAQKMNAEVGTKVAEARRMMEVDPEKAIEMLQTTMASVKAAELPAAVSRTMVRRLEVAIELSKADKVKFDERMKDKSAKAEIETKKLRILEASKVKESAIKDLMTKAEEANAKGDYAKAEELARRANEIDPNAIGPQMLAFKANMQRHYDLDKDTKLKKEEGFLNEMQRVDQGMIIDNDVATNGIIFPKTFKEMSERRKKMQLSDSRQRTVGELAIDKKLNEPITLNLKDNTLDEAIAFISNYTGLNVIVDPKALNDEGLSRESKVNLTANSIKLKVALKYLLSPLGLTYKAEDEVLLITSPQASRDKTYTWTYPVADLVVPPNKPQGGSSPFSGIPSLDAPDAQQGMSPSGTMMTPTKQNGPNWSQVQRSVTAADMMPLVQLITTTVAPGTWAVGYSEGEQNTFGMGGAFGGANGDAPAQPGSITPFLLSISLIIRHTAEVHEEVAELLKQLRRLQDLQVSIEVRFITVSDDFFEQIGVDFDFAIQSKSVGKGTSFAAPSGSNQAASYPFNLVNSTTTSGGTTTGGVSGGGATTGAGTGGGTTTGGTTGGTTTGGGAAGGGGGGAVSGGGFAGGGGGVGGAGSFGGGGTGTAGGTAGGTTTTSGTSGSGVGYIVNPFLDNSLGRRTPIVVGTSAGGIGNYTNNLAIPFTQGSAANVQPFNSIPSAGATFGISFLSDLEMYLFLTAAQGDARNNIVQAPKITTFNGANATISNNEQQYYIAQLTPIVGPGSVSFFPTPAPLNDGVVLNVTPVVSADRRYVRLSLAPVFQTINGLQSFPVPAAVGGGGLGGTGTAITGQIQLPQVTNTNINTTVTVPDGGTVLLGGVKRMREQRLEYGVPVLAKTPLINRLFRNIGIGRRTDSLMLMVTPRIIILEEEEERIGVRTINSNP